MKFEEIKTKVKERFSKAIDVLNESPEAFSKTFETETRRKFKGYPTQQLLSIIETYPEDKKIEVECEPWNQKKLQDEIIKKRWR